KGGATAQPTLEGWAIVDNTTGDDWTNVQLSLVSGRPISFISQLYEPRYIARPTAQLPGEEALAPVVYGGAIEQKDAETQVAKAMAAPAAAPPPLLRSQMRLEGTVGGVAQERNLSAPSAIASTAAGQELGELFEYSFANPVTVRKSESAMLPFLQDK